MTGMKEGAGEDPFAEDSSAVSDDDSDRGPTGGEGERRSHSGTNRSQTETVTDERRGRRQVQIPYKFRRDGVQDGRSRVPLFLQEETQTTERDALRELEERFDDNVALTDLREAVVKTGLEDLDTVERYLEEWGYGMSFDE